MRVKDVMTQSPCTCHPHDSASIAAREMWTHDCGIIPIVNDDGRIVGVVTDRDLCMAAYFQNMSLDQISLDSCMSRDVSACRPDDDVIDVERLMSQRQVHRVPVVNDDGVALGIVSLSDLARMYLYNGGGKAERDKAIELAQTVAAISMPRARGWGDGKSEARV